MTAPTRYKPVDLASGVEPLSAAEWTWVKRLAKVLAACPTERLAIGRIERLTRERDEAQREVCDWQGRDMVGQRFPGQKAGAKAARRVAKARGWAHLYPEDTSGAEEPAP